MPVMLLRTVRGLASIVGYSLLKITTSFGVRGEVGICDDRFVCWFTAVNASRVGRGELKETGATAGGTPVNGTLGDEMAEAKAGVAAKIRGEGALNGGAIGARTTCDCCCCC